MQPGMNPDVMTIRPYGIHRGLGHSKIPQDYTLQHYGGSLRGSLVGHWRETLQISDEPEPISEPTMLAWRSSRVMPKFGEQWQPDDIQAL